VEELQRVKHNFLQRERERERERERDGDVALVTRGITNISVEFSQWGNKKNRKGESRWIGGRK